VKIRISVLLACAALAAGCASQAQPGTKSTPSSSAGAASPVASPPSKASVAAASAARLFFDLYAADQYKSTYELLSPAAQKVISEHTWVQVHKKCDSAAHANYGVTQPVVAGDRAVVNVWLVTGVPNQPRDAEIFTYSGGHWLLEPTDLVIYQHHTVPEIVAKLKADGVCK
jgi:hypothetical protein